MAKQIEVKRFSAADEVRPAGHGSAAFVRFGGRSIAQQTFEPGWRWSQDVKPIAGTRSCEVSHALFVVSGRLHIQADNGETAEIGPGDVVIVQPGHDAWVVGDAPCQMIDFGDVADYARPTVSMGQQKPDSELPARH